MHSMYICECNISECIHFNAFSVFSVFPSRSLVLYLISFRFWPLNMLFASGLMNFDIFFLKKVLWLGVLLISGSSLGLGFRLDQLFFILDMFNFEIKNNVCVPQRVWFVNLRNCVKNIFWRFIYHNFVNVA